jgi:hypothetical protein
MLGTYTAGPPRSGGKTGEVTRTCTSRRATSLSAGIHQLRARSPAPIRDDPGRSRSVQAGPGGGVDGRRAPRVFSLSPPPNMRLRASLRTKVLGISTLLLSLTLAVTLVARGAFAVVEEEVAELSEATSPATVKLLNIDRDAHQALLGFETRRGPRKRTCTRIVGRGSTARTRPSCVRAGPTSRSSPAPVRRTKRAPRATFHTRA